MSSINDRHLKLPSYPLIDATIVLLQLQGLDIDEGRLTSGLPILDKDLPEELMDRALHGVQHLAQWRTSNDFNELEYPCCIETSDGRYAIAIARKDHNVYFLDAERSDAYRAFQETELLNRLSGRVFHVLPSIDFLQSEYTEENISSHWFWGPLLKQKIKFIDIVTSSLLANTLAVVTSLFALQVYDRVIPGQSEATLWVLTSGVAMAILFEAILRISRSRLIDQIGQNAEIEISRDLFQHIVNMRLDKRPASPAGIVQVVREFSSVKEFFTTASVGTVADLPFVFIFLVLIYSISGSLVVIVIFGAICTLAPSVILQNSMARLSRETMGGMASASRIMTEAAYGAESIKISGAEPFFQKQWEDVTLLNAIKTTEQRSLAALQSFWGAGIQQITYVATLIYGVYMVFDGRLTVGAIIAVSILSTRTLSPITQLSQILSRWQNMKNALNGLEKIISAPKEQRVDQTYFRRARFNGEINIRRLQFFHETSSMPALDINGFKIEPGTRLALIGKNGSGKSTLLRLLAGLYNPTQGSISLDAIDIQQIDPKDLRRNIAYLPQEIRLFRGTLKDNLATIRAGLTDEDYMEALHFAGLGKMVQQHPEGLNIPISDGGGGMSIGQRQSVGIARLYLQDSSILLLDEPTSALDQMLEKQIVSRLGDWIARRTCIVATHRPLILSQMNRVAVMDGGRIIVEDERDKVLKIFAE